MLSSNYFLIKLANKSQKYIYRCHRLAYSCTTFKEKDLTVQLKHDIEKYWQNNLGSSTFNPKNENQKFYVLSMFPYPSGNLHMGHVRVYTISDTMARFYRMTGKNVLHPMGWDAFGLPAENAAIERKIPADQWTKQNIAHMKEQLSNLGFSFDWTKEIATCHPSYYKWTQWLFLKMYKTGIAYQKEALVNWDPIDETVLADEQVDENQCSWRSGAKVEKKLLKQWFIKTTKFAKNLYDGLNDPSLIDWRDIINLQKHWIGECTGYNFDLKIVPSNSTAGLNKFGNISVWTEKPEQLRQAAFIAVSKNHILNADKNCINYRLDSMEVINLLDENKRLPIIITDQLEFPLNCDTYIGVPCCNEIDQQLADEYNISYSQNNFNSSDEILAMRQNIIEKANNMNIGGYLVSSKLKDWLISRQRRWGTPIPIIHCDMCGAVPVPEKDLPVTLTSADSPTTTVECPKCNSLNARRELDTMDTFVDSSWYFLRYLDADNNEQIFDATIVSDLMPVDLYIGGKEHAVLHLYYARFMCHFLHSVGMCAHMEPFQRLLVQGMVMGRTYRIKGSGKYLQENEIKVINEKKNQAIEIASGKPIVMQWEKMSKSKMNGVDPAKMINELSCDTLRLIILGDVAPTSHRNWSRTTFPGILNWQNRLWLALNEFNEIRSTDSIDISITETPEFIEQETKMYDARNYYIKGTTFNYLFSHQLSVALSKMQGLTNSIRKASKEQKKYGKQFELTLATLIKMLAPMAPHFSSELWSKFLMTPNRVNTNLSAIKWDQNVLEQSWPTVDKDYLLDLRFKVNGTDITTAKFTNDDLSKLTHDQALELALKCELVLNAIGQKSVVRTKYDFYPGCNGILGIFVEFEEKLRNVEELK